jgi:hypothetical protein
MTMRGLVLSLGLVLAPGCSHRSSPAEVAAQLVGTTGERIALAELLHRHAQTVVVFYRGFW